MLSRKHIRAPRSFKPGPGLPRERLAYISDAEAMMLRALTDGMVEPGPRGIPSFAVTTGTTTGTTSRSGGSTPNDRTGGLNQSQIDAYKQYGASRTAPSTTGQGGQGSGATKTSSASSSSTKASPAPSKGPSDSLSAPARTAPSAAPAKTAAPSRGPSDSLSAPARTAPSASVTRSAPPSSPMGGQGSSFSSPPAASTYNRGVTDSLTGGKNASGSTKAPTASAMTKSQTDAYRQFGNEMARAPRQPEVRREPGDAEQLARMARAENGVIRDPYTGKMSQLAAQGTMDVIRNRMENQNLPVNDVISQSGQFSPWSDGSYAATKPTPAETAMAEAVLRGYTPDYTATPQHPQGADFYHNPDTVKSGLSKASATTKSRVNDRFVGTLDVPDAVKPGVYGHTYGVDPTGRPADRTKSVPMGAPKPGQPNYGTGHIATPESLPQGALSPDPNYGRIQGTEPSLLNNVGYSAPQPNMDPVTRASINMGFNVPRGIGYNSRIEETMPIQDPNSFSTEKTRSGFYSDRRGPGGVSTPIGGNSWENGFDPNKLSQAGQNLYDAMVDTELSSGIPRSYFSGLADREEKTPQHPAGNAIDSYVMDVRTARPVGDAYPYGMKPGAARDAYDYAANRVLDTLYGNPDMYGGLANMARYGGDFRSTTPDQMHFDVQPGAGFSREQIARHSDAAARTTSSPPTAFDVARAVSDPFYDRYDPNNTGSTGFTRASTAPPSEGISIGDIVRGALNTKPMMDALGDPRLGMFAKGLNNKLTSGIAKATFSATVAPKIKDAIVKALRDAQYVTSGQAYADRQRAASGWGSPTYNYGTSAPNRTEPSSSKGGSSTKGSAKGSTKESPYNKGGQRGKSEASAADRGARRSAPIRRAPASRAPAAPATNPWDYFTNVQTREEALRQLLGKEWFA